MSIFSLWTSDLFCIFILSLSLRARPLAVPIPPGLLLFLHISSYWTALAESQVHATPSQQMFHKQGTGDFPRNFL